MVNKDKSLIFALSQSKDLAKKISQHTGIPYEEACVHKFRDGETLVSSNVSVRGKDVFIVQSTCKPVNDSCMELLIAINAIKGASAASITAIIPYYGYARQDRKAKGREPITAKMYADCLQCIGVNRVLTLDIHSEQQQGFFSVPFDSLTASWILLENFVKKNKINLDNVTIVSPDYGGVKRARALSFEIGCPIAIVDKRRPKPNEVAIENVLGEVAGRDCILPDDMIDTGGTMISVAKLLKSKGAKSIAILATHGLFNGDAVEKFDQCMKDKIIDHLLVTNSIETNKKPAMTTVVDVSEILSKVVEIYANGIGSVSLVYDQFKKIKK